MSMWPFRRKKKMDVKGTWTLGSLTAENGDLAGTHMVLEGASRHDREHPFVVFVTLSYEGGELPSEAEMQRFDEFDDRLTDCLARCPGLNVGMFTHGGIRDWICYVKDGQVAANIIDSELSSYSPKIEVKHDPTWSEYRSFAAMGKA